MHSSVIEISKSALKNNINFIRSMVKDSVTLSSVIKGNAYGHNIAVLVPLLQSLDVNHFSVFSSFEATQVFKVVKNDFTIVIMGDINSDHFDWIVENEIEFYVFNMDRLERLLARAKAKQCVLQVHIEIETGMNRTGFNQNDWSHVIKFIHENETYIHVKGLCTHFAGAESISNYIRVRQQQIIFKKAIRFFQENGIKPKQIHCSCSAAVIAFPEQHYDMVRVGILQYGLWPSRETFISYLTKNELNKSPLQPVLSWKSYIMDIKQVSKGAYIGYGNSFLAEETMKVASVPVGYGYGYNRSLSNQGRVIIDNKRYGVLGIVNMNMLLVDVSSSNSIAINDEVILIGASKDLEITVSAFSNITDELNYELLSRIDKDIPRIIKK